ncbi:MAG: 2-oxoisovalerate dehydrogenase [Acidiferrobacteraceae bacterium]
MSEIHFIVEEAPEGGYIARAVGVDIVTEADDVPSLHAQIRDAVHCLFDEDQLPGLIRLHITREEVLTS